MSKNRTISLKVPDRTSKEVDATEKQLDFIDGLREQIGAPEGSINTDHLGKWQASVLIDQLIELRDSGAQVISASSAKPKDSSRSTKWLLVLGIVVIPPLFCWFTLLPKFSFSRGGKIASFLWAAFYLYTNFTALDA